MAALLAAMLVAKDSGAAVESSGVVPPAVDTVNQLIVRYKEDPGDAQLRARMDVVRRVGEARGLTLKHGRRGALGMHVLRLDKRIAIVDAAQLANELAVSDPNIEFAEPDYILRPALIPNDPDYSSQWHYQNTTGGIYAPGAWDLTSGSGVNVAVIDTGYRPHADLAANIVGGYDFITDATRARDGDGRDSNASDEGNWHTYNQCGDFTSQNSNWHGTHVAGTIAAATNNSTGVAGVAYGAKVVPVRVFGACGGTTSDIVDAIVWASGGVVSGVPTNANPARVLNLSMATLSPVSCSSAFQSAINSALSRNSVVVVSAGNSNAVANHSPGNCGGVITVAATDYNGGKAWYSNYGDIVEIAAPGGGSFGSVYSTMNSGTTTPGSDTYGYMMGTSMAAPHVSGVAALVIARNPGASVGMVTHVLQSSARAFPATCTGCGSGIVHAQQAATDAAQIVFVSGGSAIGTDPYGGATAWFMLGSNGTIWVSTPYSGSMSLGNWLSPQTGMSNYQARAINGSCMGPTSWVSLGSDQTWSVSTGGWYEGEQASCSFTLQIRRASDGVILTSATVDMTAYTGWW